MGETQRVILGHAAINTKLDWVWSGVVSSPTQGTSSSCLVTHALRVDGLSQNLQVLDDPPKSFRELESFGLSGSDSSVYDEFRSNIRFLHGKYKVELPWKEGHPALPDNYHLCVRWLQLLIKRLQQDAGISYGYITQLSRTKFERELLRWWTTQSNALMRLITFTFHIMQLCGVTRRQIRCESSTTLLHAQMVPFLMSVYVLDQSLIRGLWTCYIDSVFAVLQSLPIERKHSSFSLWRGRTATCCAFFGTRMPWKTSSTSLSWSLLGSFSDWHPVLSSSMPLYAIIWNSMSRPNPTSWRSSVGLYI